MNLSDEQIKYMETFFPYAFGKIKAAHLGGKRFVHYTTAEAAISIIQNKEVWMRKSSYMNDYMEVTHGLDCLKKAHNNNEAGEKLNAIINNIFPNISEEIAETFNGWLPHLENETYITSVSEHLESENQLGRLSMWRAYGDSIGIALVLNNDAFLSSSDALKAYMNPVGYFTEKQFEEQYLSVISNIEKNQSYIEKMGREDLKGGLFNVYKYAILCTKHPGFEEEREWRVVYSPTLDRSDKLIKDMQTIQGTPQTVYKIPLKNYPEEGFVGAEIPEIIDRVIIGPAEFSGAVFEVFVDLLEKAGVPNPNKIIEVSDIPLRRS